VQDRGVSPAEAPNPPEIVSPSDVLDTRVFQSLDEVREALEEGFIDSINEANTALEFLGERFNQATGQQQRSRLDALIEKVKSLKAEFESAGSEAKSLKDELRDFIQNLEVDVGEQLKQTIEGAIEGISGGIGDEIGDAIFADQDQLERLRERRRSIQQNLRQAREAGNFQQVQQLSSELDRVNEKLNQTESLFGRLGQAFQNIGQLFKQIVEQIISQLVKLITKLIVVNALKAALGAFTGGTSNAFSGLIAGGGVGSVASVGTGVAATTTSSAQISNGNLVVPTSLVDQATTNGQQRRSRTGRRSG